MNDHFGIEVHIRHIIRLEVQMLTQPALHGQPLWMLEFLATWQQVLSHHRLWFVVAHESAHVELLVLHLVHRADIP